VDRDLWHAGYKHVVVVVERDEGQENGWKSGFYKSRLAPHEVFRRLVEQPLVDALGRDNVIRVEVEVAPSVDALGRDAMLTTVVIAPNAIQRLGSESAVNAEVRLRRRLREMHVTATPILDFATEAELAEDVGS
jgi:hypothetical protein